MYRGSLLRNEENFDGKQKTWRKKKAWKTLKNIYFNFFPYGLTTLFSYQVMPPTKVNNKDIITTSMEAHLVSLVKTVNRF